MKPGEDALDAALALSSVGGDVEFLGEVAGIVEAALPALLRDIQNALADRDLRAVEKRARLVKHAARDVSAKRTFEAVLALETAARYGEFEAAERAACELDKEAGQLQQALAALGRSVSFATLPSHAEELC